MPLVRSSPVMTTDVEAVLLDPAQPEGDAMPREARVVLWAPRGGTTVVDEAGEEGVTWGRVV
jgi:hypothetical protein